MVPNPDRKAGSQLLLFENEDVERLPTFEKRGYRTIPILYVNGVVVPESIAKLARPNQTLLQFLRDEMNLSGTKLGCAEGGCGACTVMISKRVQVRKSDISSDGQQQQSIPTTTIKHYSVNACLMPVLAADCCHITTIEGIGSVRHGNVHPVQQAMVDFHGSQCGFCTPGIIVSIYTHLLAKTGSSPDQPLTSTVEHLEEHLDGNLCRCTGYRPIWDAARALCNDAADDNAIVVRGPCGVPCRECPERDTCTQVCNVSDKVDDIDDTHCTSSSKDKVLLYQEILSKMGTQWAEQPNSMFPKELLDMSNDDFMYKSLVVVDTTKFHAGGTWFKSTTLLDTLQLLDEFAGQCKIVVGNTEVGIETRFKHAVYPRLICPSDSITELYSIGLSSVNSTNMIEIGSCCPLSTIQEQCGLYAHDVNTSVGLKRTALPIHDMLRWFASSQIRNVACLGGNLVTASPISDMNPVMASLGATLTLSSVMEHSGTDIVRRSVPVADFFVKYRTVDLKPNEIVECISVPIVGNVFEYVKPFKQARRREDDISIVTSGMKIRLSISEDGNKFIIDDISIAFGGMAPTTILARKTMKALLGAEFCAGCFECATEVLLDEIKLPKTVPGGQAAFRMTLTASFLYKFYLSTVQELTTDIAFIKEKRSLDPGAFPELPNELPTPPSVDELEASGATNFVVERKPRYYGIQKYPKPRVAKGLEEKELTAVEEVKPDLVVVGTPSTHMSGPLHCTGEALYNDDIPLPPGCLQAALVLSNQCGGKLEEIDVSPALSVPGVVGVYTAKDIATIGGYNKLGIISKDEYVFLPIGEQVDMVAQTLGIVVAETLESAELAARLVKVTYTAPAEGSKVIVTMEDAIEVSSFYEFSRHTLERGDMSLLNSLSDTPVSSDEKPKVGEIVQVSGSFRSGPQEHFYLETQSTLVVPSEANTNLTIYSSTQASGKTHNYCASSTGTPAHKVVVRVKRLGGGFGGKESRNVSGACAAAVAAKVSNRPVRLTFARDVDMKTTGTRHAFLSTYKASAQITEDGAQLIALDVKIYNNGGSAFDLSGPVLDRALFHIDNCYYFPNLRAEGVVCKTSQAPHTAFRGFGGPQGMVVAEHVMDHLSLVSGVPGDKLRRSNFFKDGDTFAFGTVVGEETSGKWNIPSMWDRLYTEMKVPDRRKEIEEFNSKNKWVKRGLSVLPTRFGIAFTAKYMNQGGALVHCYQDGTVLVSHGGTEMGQGLHTKVCQVAAQAFGIPLEHVYVNDSSTDKVANTIPTAASMSTDQYGMATLDACRQILSRLEPVRKELGPDASFKEVVLAAHFKRIDLSAHGFFALNGIRCGYDWAKEKPEDWSNDLPANAWKGQPFNYFTQGCACTEVEVDLLTGNHKTLRSDLLVDVGSSINPMIDIGQIEGAFIQGMGWSTIEEVIYSDDDHVWIRPRGALFTTGPGTYKIPSFNDVPEVFNVTLMDKVDNPFAVHSSKAVGEPPFFLGTSVFYAIKDAIVSARKQNLGDDSYFEMRLPATSERIRMYSGDVIAGKAAELVSEGIANIKSFQPQGSY